MSQQAQEVYLAILGAIAGHARIYFRGVRCPQTRDDMIQETLAIAWKWTRRLLELGEKDPRDFPTGFAALVARHVRSGRRLAGIKGEKNDVLSPVARILHGFRVEPL